VVKVTKMKRKQVLHRIRNQADVDRLSLLHGESLTKDVVSLKFFWPYPFAEPFELAHFIIVEEGVYAPSS
jgi:hypothetical protein